jgi:hypothetical protein
LKGLLIKTGLKTILPIYMLNRFEHDDQP